MFDDIKRYQLDRKEDQSPICPLDGYKIKLGIVCNNCGKTFCRKHREENISSLKDLLTQPTTGWICPLCIQSMKNFGNPSNFGELLKAGKIEEFMKKIF